MRFVAASNAAQRCPRANRDRMVAVDLTTPLDIQRMSNINIFLL
jgi:hypothetical protein